MAEQEVEETFIGVVDEGRRRLSRRWWPLLATGAVGGIGLVTVLRLLQVPHKVADERANPAPGVPIGDDLPAEEELPR